MAFDFFTIWKFTTGYGFIFLSFDFDRPDELTFCLLGFQHHKKEREIGIDFLWKYFEFKY